MNNIKAIITDLDDTLLSPEKTVSKEAKNMIQELQEKNIIFTFITGRPKYAIERFADQLNIKYPVVACNGAIIFKGKEVLLKHSFKISKLRKILERANELDLTVLYYTNDIEYALKETHWVKVRLDLGRIFPVKPLSEEEWNTIKCEKVNIMSDGKEEAFAKIKDEIEQIANEFSIAIYDLNGCEIVANKVNKAVGMEELGKILGVKTSEIMAIGDNINDNQMLKEAGFSVAVGNAKDETKICADYISINNYTDGVIEAVNKFILGKENHI